MLNAKKMLLTAAILSVFSASAAMAAKPAPKCPPALELTSQQWEMLKGMKPEEQKMAFCQGVRQNLIKEKMAALNPDQRKEVEDFIKEDREHRQMMKEKMEKMTKEQKEAIRLQMPRPQKHHGKMARHNGPMQGKHPMPGPAHLEPPEHNEKHK